MKRRDGTRAHPPCAARSEPDASLHVDIAPGRMRAGLIELLRRAEASGFSLQAMRAQLEPKASSGTRLEPEMASATRRGRVE